MAVSVMAGNPAMKQLYADLKRRMDQAVAGFQANLASIRTGRASAHMLDQVKVDYYGTPMPVNQIAQVSAPEPQMILIAPWPWGRIPKDTWAGSVTRSPTTRP